MVGERTGGGVARSAKEAFAALGAAVPAFQGIDYADVGTRGALINESVSLTGD
jgi:hypothetical protein